MKQTIDIMTAAHAKGVELPGEWFAPMCDDCYQAHANKWDASFLPWPAFCSAKPWPAFCSANRFHDAQGRTERYIGPDLERAENTHHAFTVADALAARGCRAEVWWVDERKLFSGTLDGGFNESFAPERHLALVAACEAALGIQHDKEIT